MPSEVRLQIARVTNKDVWEVEKLLKVIKVEVEAREISDTIKVQEVRNSDTSRGNVRPTASTLMSENIILLEENVSIVRENTFRHPVKSSPVCQQGRRS